MNDTQLFVNQIFMWFTPFKKLIKCPESRNGQKNELAGFR
jgi:hypothetical protein